MDLTSMLIWVYILDGPVFAMLYILWRKLKNENI
tara:strand:+ start:1176 stop:1277 length:102 start_codon:yes stop_codon:yes gene_type:complete